MIIEVMRGKDGKRYPAGLPRPAEELTEVRALTHELYCGRGRSIRDVQALLLSRHGIRRSIGIIHRDLAAFDCGRPCRGSGSAG